MPTKNLPRSSSYSLPCTDTHPRSKSPISPSWITLKALLLFYFAHAVCEVAAALEACILLVVGPHNCVAVSPNHSQQRAMKAKLQAACSEGGGPRGSDDSAAERARCGGPLRHSGRARRCCRCAARWAAPGMRRPASALMGLRAAWLCAALTSCPWT